MTRIEQMIKDMCPLGVEWKTIKETVGVNRGKRLVKSQLKDDGLYEVFHGSKDTPLGRYDEYNAPKDTIIIVNTGGIGGVKYLNNDFWCSDGSFWLGHSDVINNKFLYYFLSRYEDYFESQKRVGGVPTIDRAVVENFEIPVPPLEIQKKIVECLDKFSALAAELQAELQKRRTQYEYYRTQLLTPPPTESNSATKSDDRNWEWKTLGEICDIKVGGEPPKNLSKEKDAQHPYPIYGNGRDVYGYTDSYKIDADAVAISSIGANTGAVFFYPAFFTPIIRLKVLLPKNSDVNIRYLYYACSLIDFKSKKSSVPNMSADDIRIKKVLLPPIKEQNRIVSILDRFEKLLTSMEEGIPAEQAAQQKRYEYYRDLLLTFDRKAV